MAPSTELSSQHSSALYRFVWRWHFYAGLLVAPFLIILAVTGGLYLYAQEIEGVWYGDLIRVKSTPTLIAPSKQEAAVLAAYPGAQITRYVAPPTTDRAAEWSLRTRGGEARTVFVDPGDGRITGSIRTDTRLKLVLSGLHGELLLGRTGDTLVELAGCWAFVLLVTGVFLWWPRRGRSAGTFVPRLSAKGRSFWRDLHAVPSLWNLPVIAFLILTGLPWSGMWGKSLASLGTLSAVSGALAPTPNFIEAPGVGIHADHATPTLENNPDAQAAPWAVRHAPLPSGTAAHARIGIDQLTAEAEAREIHRAGLSVIYPSGPGGVFTLSFVPDIAQGQRTVHVDPADGRILQDIGWREYSPLGKAVELGVETHMGRQFGAANRLVMLASCLLIVLTLTFATVSWWSRRPKGSFGAPPVPDRFKAGALVVIVACAMGILFPLVGVSMVLIYAADRVLMRAAPRLHAVNRAGASKMP